MPWYLVMHPVSTVCHARSFNLSVEFIMQGIIARLFFGSEYLFVPHGMHSQTQVAKWHTTDDELPFPRAFYLLIGMRLDRLSIAQQLILKVASVVGTTFSSSQVVAMCPLEALRASVTSCNATCANQLL